IFRQAKELKVMRMRKIAAVAAVAALSATLMSCSSDAERDGEGSAEIRVLFSAPLTGDSAESGRAMLDGAELAAEIINEAGGVTGPDGTARKIVVEGADDEMTSQGANAI